MPRTRTDPPPPADRSTAHVIQIATQWVNGALIVLTTVRLFANSQRDDSDAVFLADRSRCAGRRRSVAKLAIVGVWLLLSASWIMPP